MSKLQELLSAQKELDDFYDKQHNLNGQSMLSERYLALMVEIGETANEWRQFKFWSKDRASRTKLLLEEYVDGLHFVLGIANVLDFNVKEVFFPKQGVTSSYEEVLDQFSLIQYAIVNYQRLTFVYNWESVMSEYLLLGIMLGFTLDEIHQAYFEKHKENYARQQRDY